MERPWKAWPRPSAHKLRQTFIVLALAIADAQAPAPIRGVSPDLLNKYILDDGIFTCFSGGQPIPAARINDNYCDCIDGSDEPGTSACPSGQFYCPNKGYLPKLLNASAVDDGICDCCDGSDEISGKCPSTCQEAGAEYRAALRAKSTATKLGLKAREKYISKAAAKKKEWQSEVDKLRGQKGGLQKAVDDLKARKERIETEEQKERAAEEALRKKEEEAKKAEEPPIETTEPTTAEPAAVKEGDSQEGDAENERELNELLEESEANTKAVPVGESVEEEVEGEEPLSLEEQGRRIASQWTRDPEASGHPEEKDKKTSISDLSAGSETDGAARAEVPKYEVPDMTDSSNKPAQPHAQSTGLLGRVRAWASNKLGWDILAKVTPKSDRQKVKDEYQSENQKLTDLDRRQSELEGNLGNDFGPEDVFLTLIERCYEVKVEKYVYEVCPFRSAAQKDGGMSTSLGSWKGFEDNYSTMVFQNGQHCWNGPNRSLKVTLECGAKEDVSHVEEPNKCEYHAKMVTPAACLAQDSQMLQKQIAELDKPSLGKEEL